MKKLGLLIILFLFAQTLSAVEPRMLSTGIGIDQRQETHDDFNVKLVFFVDNSELLANMTVEIVDARRRLIVNTVSYGPWLFLDLPEGQYFLIASRQNGDTQSTSFRAHSNTQTEVALMFPAR